MRTILSILFITACAWTSHAQTTVTLSYPDYMRKVRENNLAYAAEKLNISIASAGVTASKVFNDPNLSLSYFNNENRTLQMGEGVEVELSKTFTFGKRSANIALAKSEKELSKALLADFFHNLRADATISYLEALKQVELYKVKENAYENVRRLAEANSIRLRLGKIMAIDATQSQVEAGILHNQLLEAKANLGNAFTSLNPIIGYQGLDTLFTPRGNLLLPQPDFILADLINTALTNRADLMAVLKNSEVAQRALKVARRERNTDVDLSIAVSHNERVYNEEAPAPPYTGVTAGIAIPLKFSNFNKGSVTAARLKAQQAETQYQQAQLEVQTEVMKAFQSYQSLAQQIERYQSGLLEQAKQVVESKIYSYNRGEVSLLEVLNAQRTYDEVQAQYIETQFNFSAALVELERCSGIWDIQL